jgi:molecular chaperone HtpG
VRWVSGGTGDFEVETITRAAARHQRHPAPARRRAGIPNAWKLKDIIGKYSDHISLPILMEKEEWKEADQPR